MIAPAAIAKFLAELLEDQRLRSAAAGFVAAIVPKLETAPAGLLSRRELARRLGVSEATVRRLDPPGLCVGDESTRRYDLAEVRAWLAARSPEPTTPRKPRPNVSRAVARAGLVEVPNR